MRAIGEVPQHEKFDLADAKLIAPGKPGDSVLYHRMGMRGQGQMPPLATKVVDERGMELMREWIEGMKGTR